MAEFFIECVKYQHDILFDYLSFTLLTFYVLERVIQRKYSKWSALNNVYYLTIHLNWSLNAEFAILRQLLTYMSLAWAFSAHILPLIKFQHIWQFKSPHQCKCLISVTPIISLQFGVQIFLTLMVIFLHKFHSLVLLDIWKCVEKFLK